MYKLAKNNRWMKDGRYVKESDVPEGDKKLSKKECIFCEEKGDHQRIYKGMMLPICENHYYSTTYGSLVGEFNKLMKGHHGINKATL